jgi:hypothetical protein
VAFDGRLISNVGILAAIVEGGSFARAAEGSEATVTATPAHILHLLTSVVMTGTYHLALVPVYAQCNFLGAICPVTR